MLFKEVVPVYTELLLIPVNLNTEKLTAHFGNYIFPGNC
jgi:hypothetical protein